VTLALGNVSVYARGSTLVVTSDSRTDAGFLVSNGWFTVVPDSASDAFVGGVAAEALRHCEADVPVPDWKAQPHGNLPSVYRAVGVRGWRGFAQHARLVTIRVDDEGIEVRPWAREDRPRSAFEGVPEKSLRLDAEASHAELGAALRLVLQDAV
jgi:hypothetical protein